MGCIEVVVRYQLVGCVCLMKVPFQPLMKLQVQGWVRIVRLMCVLCGVLPRLHLPKKEGEKRGRRIEGRELVIVYLWIPSNLYDTVRECDCKKGIEITWHLVKIL